MKLDVLATSTDKEQLWYADGLKFTCSQCGNCCTGGPGYVWVSDEEIGRLADFLKLSREQTIEKYCRNVFGKISLKEQRNSRGEYDCVFLVDQKPAAASNGVESSVVMQTKRGCGIYPVRPLQCRTWPFWDGNLMSEESWARAAIRCHGMNRGKAYGVEKIVSLRDTTDWPEQAPTSDATVPTVEVPKNPAQ